GPEASGALFKKRQKPKSKKPPTKSREKIQLTSTGLPSTLDEGTHKSQPLPEITTIDPKDSVGNKQPIDTGLPSTTSDEGTAKTTPRPKGSLGDKDSGETYHPLISNQYTLLLLIFQGLVLSTRTSFEVELDTKPLQLQTFADVQAFLLSKDELDKESDKEEVLAAGEDIDKDPQVAEEVRTPSPKQDQPEPSHVHESTSDSSSPDLKKFDNIPPLTKR
ncbi:hypothetical protein Tco_1298187, partial [Tanacetum coccineum]